MPRYLFFTYGEAGWRGVQMRALRIAAYFDKKDVIFWNIYDSGIIEDAGFAVETKPGGLADPDDITFPRGTETVIFADLPTNELYQYSVYRAALAQNKKIVVCDQVYRRGQLKEFAFREIIRNSGLFIANSLSFLREKTAARVLYVPPQIEIELSEKDRLEIRKKYMVPAKSFLVFVSAYNEEILFKAKKVLNVLKNKNIYFIVSSTSNKQLRTSNSIHLPFVSGNEYFRLLYAADAALLKFGYLQILEALSLGKPALVLGEAGKVLQHPKALDDQLKKCLFFWDKPDDISRYLEKLLADPSFYAGAVRSINRLHDGSLFGARLAASAIKKLGTSNPTSPWLRGASRQLITKDKKLIILVNEEIARYKTWIEATPGIYPVGFIMPAPRSLVSDAPKPLWRRSGEVGNVIKRIPDRLTDEKLSHFQSVQEAELLPHSFRQLFVFSRRKYDGFLDIGSWFQSLVSSLAAFFKSADEIFLTEKSLMLFRPLLESTNSLNKLKLLKLLEQ